MDTSAAMYLGQDLGGEISQQEAELYCKIYALAAEDFSTIPDVLTYIKSNTECLMSIQNLLKKLMSILSKHTHAIPPHTHALQPHTHPDPVSGITGPNIGSLVTMATPLVSDIPAESTQIMWSSMPAAKYINTSGALPNLEGNTVISGPSLKGPMKVTRRRAKVPLVLTQPSVLPLVKGMVKL